MCVRSVRRVVGDGLRGDVQDCAGTRPVGRDVRHQRRLQCPDRARARDRNGRRLHRMAQPRRAEHRRWRVGSARRDAGCSVEKRTPAVGSWYLSAHTTRRGATARALAGLGSRTADPVGNGRDHHGRGRPGSHREHRRRPVAVPGACSRSAARRSFSQSERWPASWRQRGVKLPATPALCSGLRTHCG